MTTIPELDSAIAQVVAEHDLVSACVMLERFAHAAAAAVQGDTGPAGVVLADYNATVSALVADTLHGTPECARHSWE